MRWRGAQTTIATALATSALAGALASPHLARGEAAQATVYATVGASPAGAPMPTGFLGLSLEYPALTAYAGADPSAPNPVFEQLLRNLAPGRGQAPVLRIGGDSTDSTWWPVRGMTRPAGIRYGLTASWLRSARTLAAALGARLIMGVNLAAGRPELAAAEAGALLRTIGRTYLKALEIGNEPDVYGVFPWYTGRHGLVYSRGHRYGLNAFLRQFAVFRAALPKLPVAGPSFAELSWMTGLQRFIQAAPQLRIVTVHRYPLQGCLTDPSSPSYPSIVNLLGDRASTGLAQSLTPYVGVAHAHGLQFRVDEMNSAAVAACLGRTGVSATFASALWAIDALFNLASVGVDGVNLHSLPRAAYELFTFGKVGTAVVHPEYYGLLLFAQAFPPGARLLPVAVHNGPVKVWATRGVDGHTRVVLINKDTSSPHEVALQLPGSTPHASLEWLRAPSADATSGVTLGGTTFGSETGTGLLSPPPAAEPISPLLGWYSIGLPAASAVLLTQ